MTSRSSRSRIRGRSRSSGLLSGVGGAVILLLTACAPAASGGAGPEPAGAHTPQDPFGCGIGLSSVSAVLGETIQVSRAPAAECLSFLPGSVHTLRLEPMARFPGAPSQEEVTVTIGNDGSFTASLTVPEGTPVGRAVLKSEPADTGYCDSAGRVDCILPAVRLEIGYAERDLRPLTVVRSDVETPTLPDLDLDSQVGLPPAFARPGPGKDELTLVMWGSGCRTVPERFVSTAAADELAVVSTEHIPAGGGCDAMARPWTSVIMLPPDRPAPRAVRVDNVEAVLLDAGATG